MTARFLLTGNAINNVSTIAKKVLDDIRPTEKPGSSEPCRNQLILVDADPTQMDGHRGLFKSILTNKP